MSTTTQPATTTTCLLAQLRAEWDRDLADHPTPWTHPSLAARFATIGDIVRYLHRRDVKDAEAIFAALLSEQDNGDHRAGRTMLQAMLPRANALTRLAQRRGFTEPQEAAVEALWSVIANYPHHRPGSIVANIAMEAMQRMGGDDFDHRRHQLEEAAGFKQIPIDIYNVLDEADITGPNSSVSTVEQAAKEATQLLRWAQDTQVLTNDEVQLLAQLHLSDDAPSIAQWAANEGISAAAARKRVSRATQKLSAAVQNALS